MRWVEFLLITPALPLALGSAPTEGKIDCRLPGYNAQAPSLSELRLEESEKREVVQLVQEGKKIAAIRVLRKCRDLTLQEQKRLVDLLQKSF